MLLFNSMVMLLINLIFFVMYERLKPAPEEILPMVVVCCLASLGRVVFAGIPQVQPVTAIVIIFACVYGCRRGYIAGALCALISNMMLGQGPWTLFQMVAWGMVGVIAALIGKMTIKMTEKKRLIIFSVYGFIAAYIFSFITDFLSICYIGDNVNVASIIAVYASGFAFATGHAIGNVIFIWMFYGILSRKLIRIRNMQ